MLRSRRHVWEFLGRQMNEYRSERLRRMQQECAAVRPDYSEEKENLARRDGISSLEIRGKELI